MAAKTLLTIVGAFFLSILSAELQGSATNMTENLKIGAFNVQTFGLTKMSYQNVADTLVKRYHIVLVQEIRDSTGQAVADLLNRLNNASGFSYSMNISERLGRTSSKEQYAFVYRSDLVSVKKAYVYDDGDEDTGEDTFQREPYIVHINSPNTVIQDFALVAIHTSPSDAAAEIDYLVDVYDDVDQRWSMENVLILGDLNAACSYMKDQDWKTNRLATDSRFDWLISDCVDTTVAGSACAYDRFVSAGSGMTAAVVPGSGNRFKFDTAYNLNEDTAARVSDHYPIELELYSKDLATTIGSVRQAIEHKFFAVSPASIGSDMIYKLRYQNSNPLLSQGFTVVNNDTAVDLVQNTKAANTSQDAVLALQLIYQSWSTLLNKNQVDLAVYRVEQGLTTNSSVVKLACRKVPSPVECWVAIEV